jgi:undecaprenyl-diphosphatase
MQMDLIIKAIIMGIVEGLTEFLPISSTGHLIVAGRLLALPENLRGTFEIFIQLGAVIAVIIFYWADLFRQFKAVPRDRDVQRLWSGVLVAFVPAAVVGFLLVDWIDEVLFNPVVVALSLIIGGVFFLWIERRSDERETAAVTTSLEAVTLLQALYIGLAQLAALIPGVSRSGASIIGGMLAGLNRRTATQFSFYLAIPTLGVATVYSLLKNFDQISSNDLVALIVGMVVAGVIAWLSIGWLLRYVSNNNFIPFGYYRIFAGTVILLLTFGLNL